MSDWRDHYGDGHRPELADIEGISVARVDGVPLEQGALVIVPLGYAAWIGVPVQIPTGWAYGVVRPRPDADTRDHIEMQGYVLHLPFDAPIRLVRQTVQL